MNGVILQMSEHWEFRGCSSFTDGETFYLVTGLDEQPARSTSIWSVQVEGSIPLIAYPNPSSDKIAVQFTPNSSYQLSSLSGTTIESGHVNKAGLLVLENRPPGIYLLKLFNLEEEVLLKVGFN